MPLVYGLSVVFNGPVSDRIGGKKAFLFGAVGVVIMNLLFNACISFRADAGRDGRRGPRIAKVVTPAVLSHGFTSASVLTLMVTIWGFNGYFQSFGALSIVKVNAQWFHVRERGTFAGIFGVLIRIGLLLGFLAGSADRYGSSASVRVFGSQPHAWEFCFSRTCS